MRAERRFRFAAPPRLQRAPGAQRRQQPRGDLRIGAVEMQHDLGEELVAGAVGAVELRLVGGEAADQRARCGWGWRARRRDGASAPARGRACRARRSAPAARTTCRGSAARPHRRGRNSRTRARAPGPAGSTARRGRRTSPSCSAPRHIARWRAQGRRWRRRRRTSPARRCARRAGRRSRDRG